MRRSRTLWVATGLVLLLAGRAFAGALEDGRAHLAAKRFPEAAAAFEKALAGSPSSKEALGGYAQAVVGGKLADRYVKAQESLQTALKKAPDDRDLRLALARVFSARADQDPRWHADVEQQYRLLHKANPEDEDAVAGLGLMYLARADHARGLEILEPLLAAKPASAKAQRVKGEILYDQAVLSFGKSKSIAGETKDLFEKARAAFRASVEADPSSFDAWLKRAYSAQYLGQVDTGATAEATEAYEKALGLDGESELPLKGLSKVVPGDAWLAKLAALSAAHPKSPAVGRWYAYALLQGDKLDEAEKVLRALIAAAPTAKGAQSLLAQVLTKKGDEAGAAKAYEAALRENPEDATAIAALEAPLIERFKEATGDPGKLKALHADYRRLLEAAPRNIWIRNNLGLGLRDAFGPNKQKSGPTHPRWVLDESVKAYEEASALIGEWQEGFERTIPYATRHAYAQVLNDTGLMFQYYPEVEDLAKAEAYYRRAQEWTQHGYWDAYGNLMKILVAKERWQDAVEYAEACAEGLKNESGESNETYRATAAGEAEKLRKRLGQ
jgi:tetratricopeptide (TPR) repeat protein